jgi:purine-binding chemotaxis protein CheW
VSSTIARSKGAVGSPKQDMHFVSFMLGGMHYGVEVSDVYGIYHGLPIIPTPDSSPSVAGELQLVDRRIPVVSLRRFAGMRERGGAEHGPEWIVIVENSRGPIGLVVDGVSEVVKLTPSNVILSKSPAPGPVGNYVTAVASHEDHPMYLPDFTRLLHDAVQ